MTTIISQNNPLGQYFLTEFEVLGYATFRNLSGFSPCVCPWPSLFSGTVFVDYFELNSTRQVSMTLVSFLIIGILNPTSSSVLWDNCSRPGIYPISNPSQIFFPRASPLGQNDPNGQVADGSSHEHLPMVDLQSLN
jgi:hypothetical protein